MNPIFLSAKKRDVLKHSSLGIPSYSQMMSKGCPSSPPNSYRFFGVPWNHSQKVIGSSRALQTLVGSKTSFFSHKKIMQFFRTNMTCHLPDTPDPPVISESVSTWGPGEPFFLVPSKNQKKNGWTKNIPGTKYKTSVGARRCPSVDFGGFFGSSVFFFVSSVPVGARRWMVDFFGFVDAFMVLVAVVGAMGRVEVPWPSRVWWNFCFSDVFVPSVLVGAGIVHACCTHGHGCLPSSVPVDGGFNIVLSRSAYIIPKFFEWLYREKQAGEP